MLPLGKALLQDRETVFKCLITDAGVGGCETEILRSKEAGALSNIGGSSRLYVHTRWASKCRHSNERRADCEPPKSVDIIMRGASVLLDPPSFDKDSIIFKLFCNVSGSEMESLHEAPLKSIALAVSSASKASMDALLR